MLNSKHNYRVLDPTLGPKGKILDQEVNLALAEQQTTLARYIDLN